jgi:hypothetical protein
MARYPRASKPNYGLDLANVFAADLGAPALASANRLVTVTHMINGAYTVLNGGHSADHLPRNVTVTHSADGTVDTLGTITVTGLDALGGTITEVITPLDGTIAAGVKCFAQVDSIVGAGWEIAVGNDTITVGFGTLVGFPSYALRRAPAVAAAAQVFAVILDGALVAASVTFDADDLPTCSVDASASTYDGTKRLVALVLR